MFINPLNEIQVKYSYIILFMIFLSNIYLIHWAALETPSHNKVDRGNKS